MDLRRPPPPARARFRRRDEAEVLQESLRTPPGTLGTETGEELAFRRPSVSERDFRRLRGGRVAVQAWIDLHGMTSAQARSELEDFVDECLRRGLRCIGVVHGKGKRSGPGGPVLKVNVDAWLRRWDEVLAFCSAPPRDGGTGAAYVLLRR